MRSPGAGLPRLDCEPALALLLRDNGGTDPPFAAKRMRTIERPAIPVERQRLSDNIYAHLLGEIVDGRFRVGDRLPPENRLAQQFGVSRPVLREALRRLQGDGVVVSRQGAGNYVERSPSKRVTALTSNVTLHDVLESFELRLSLEVLSARLAARNHNAAQLREIERVVALMRTRMSQEQSPQEADYQFHRAIAAASGNSLLVQTLDFLAERLHGATNVTLSVTPRSPALRHSLVLDEHDRIVHAIRVRDADSAAIAMSFHLDQSRQRLLDGKLDL